MGECTEHFDSLVDEKQGDEDGDTTEPAVRERPVPHEIEGYLLKLKHKPSTFSSWNKRYFKVDPATETLSYFDNEKDASLDTVPPCKVFKLGHVAKVIILRLFRNF